MLLCTILRESEGSVAFFLLGQCFISNSALGSIWERDDKLKKTLKILIGKVVGENAPCIQNSHLGQFRMHSL